MQIPTYLLTLLHKETSKAKQGIVFLGTCSLLLHVVFHSFVTLTTCTCTQLFPNYFISLFINSMHSLQKIITINTLYLFICAGIIITIYYIDTSVLLENILLVKFKKTTSGTGVVYFP